MHQPRKRFGQNFLKDLGVIDAILHAFQPESSDKVIEIGPGLGALTKPLLGILESLTAIEIDRDLAQRLSQLPKLNLVCCDALVVDYSTFGENQRIIGNLPYNISTPLLLRLLSFAPMIKDMHFMLQKEVADRLSALPGSKIYGRLSVMVQYRCDVQPLFDVPPGAFYPKPKVESAVCRLTPHPVDPSISLKTLELLVSCAFSMRRKTLANNLKPLLSALELEKIGIDPKLRPEQICVREYVHMAKFLSK